MKLPGNTKAGGQAWPRIDEHLVEPEVSRQEIVDGHLIEASPAHAPHGDEHARLDLVITAHVRPGWRASSDLLTRVDQNNNFATDTCVRREGVDPETGARYLEELAFEVKSTQSLGHLKRRARAMLRRGVRRFFVVCVKELDGPSGASSDVKTGPVLEWIPDAGTWPDGDWHMLGNQDVIDDPCLARPIEVAALLDVVSAEIAVGRALIAKENPAIVAYGDSRYLAGQLEGKRAGQLEGKRDALRAVMALRDLAPSAEHLARIDACSDPDLLDRWLRAALAATRTADIFDS
jgi:Putative restriction endonuclease